MVPFFVLGEIPPQAELVLHVQAIVSSVIILSFKTISRVFSLSLNISGFGTSESASRQYFIIDSEAETSPKRKSINLSQVKETSCVCPIHGAELWGVVGAQLGTV